MPRRYRQHQGVVRLPTQTAEYGLNRRRGNGEPRSDLIYAETAVPTCGQNQGLSPRQGVESAGGLVSSGQEGPQRRFLYCLNLC